MKPLTFALLAAGLAVTAANADIKTAPDTPARVVEVRKYTAAPGKLDALDARMKDHAAAFLKKHGVTLHGAFVPIENKAGVIYLVVSHKSVEARKASFTALAADEEWKKVVADSDKDGKLLAKAEETILTPTDYSPDPAKYKPADKPRSFELRIYTATPGNLDRLNARFRDHTVKLFEKYGMVNVVYGTPPKGAKDADKLLVYLLAHESDDARKKSFDEFRKDPAWVEARAASEKAGGGSLTEAKDGVVSVPLKATDYSPMK